MSKERLGANGVWPRVPKFDIPGPPSGYPSGDHIILDEADEGILDKVWAEVMCPPHADTSGPSADGAAPSSSSMVDGDRQNRQATGPRKRSRKAEPPPAWRPA